MYIKRENLDLLNWGFMMFKILLLLGILGINQTDTPWLYYYPYSNGSIAVNFEASNYETTISIPKTFYIMGDTLQMTLTIENTGADTLIVWDPDLFNPRATFGKIQNEYFVYTDIGRYYDGIIYLEGLRLQALYPKASVRYQINCVLNSDVQIDSAAVVSVELGSICWQYDSKMKSTKIVDGRYVYMNSLDTAVELYENSRRTILGSINIVVFDRPERIITE